MARYRMVVNKKFVLLTTIVFGSFLLFAGDPDCLEQVNIVKSELAASNINASCQILDCQSLEDCERLKEDGRRHMELIESDLQSSRCMGTLSKVKTGTLDEIEMPLAFSILAHRDFAQLYKLVTAIYRPHNLYCIQLDSKSDPKFVETVKNLVNCLAGQHGNIFLSSRNISLIWQHSSLLEGDLYCLEQLLENSHPWKYYVNIVGSEFPMITNDQLIRKLKGVTNQVGLVHTLHSHKEVTLRWKFSHVLPKESSGGFQTTFFGSYYKNVPVRTKTLKSPPPQGLTIMYGLKNSAISRKFADFAINSQIAKELRAWLADVQVAVEHFYPTLATVFLKNDQFQLQELSDFEDMNSFLMRKTFWYGEGYTCRGQVRREICVLSLLDLPQILKYSQTEGFVMNKFDSELDDLVVDCLSEVLYGR